MTRSQFVKALKPIWIAEIITSAIHSIIRGDISNLQLIDLPFNALSLIVFPLISGSRVARFGAKLRYSALAGVAVSLASIGYVTFAFVFRDANWKYVVLGYLISTLLLAVPVQALFGFLGGKFGYKQFNRT